MILKLEFITLGMKEHFFTLFSTLLSCEFNTFVKARLQEDFVRYPWLFGGNILMLILSLSDFYLLILAARLHCYVRADFL